MCSSVRAENRNDYRVRWCPYNDVRTLQRRTQIYYPPIFFFGSIQNDYSEILAPSKFEL